MAEGPLQVQSLLVAVPAQPLQLHIQFRQFLAPVVRISWGILGVRGRLQRFRSLVTRAWRSLLGDGRSLRLPHSRGRGSWVGGWVGGWVPDQGAGGGLGVRRARNGLTHVAELPPQPCQGAIFGGLCALRLPKAAAQAVTLPPGAHLHHPTTHLSMHQAPLPNQPVCIGWTAG